MGIFDEMAGKEPEPTQPQVNERSSERSEPDFDYEPSQEEIDEIVRWLDDHPPKGDPVK